MSEYCEKCGDDDWLYKCENCGKELCEVCYGDITLTLCKDCIHKEYIEAVTN